MAGYATTTRAYTLKLSGDGNWRELLWKTHVVVNRGAHVWGDWLLTLRGGLPASLAANHPERRVLLALSWLSVEGPMTLVPREHRIAAETQSPSDRSNPVLSHFRLILDRLGVRDPEDWIAACEPALTARIRDDACWVDRSPCFLDLQQRFPGLTCEWAADTLFDFLGGADAYFATPENEAAEAAEGKDFVQKAGGWFSRNWGAGEKSDASAIADRLRNLADTDASKVVGQSGPGALVALLRRTGSDVDATVDPKVVFKRLKQMVGWKGRPSKGAMALEKLSSVDRVAAEHWELACKKMLEEADEQSVKSNSSGDKPGWMALWREQMESRLGMPYRIDKDLIWESGVMLDHALRRVSAAHTWIKRAEVERRSFAEDAQKIAGVPESARNWLDAFCEARSTSSGAMDDYLIRRRALDAWDRIVQAWNNLADAASAGDRIAAARAVEAGLDDNEKFGDIQLFESLAVDEARCVWQSPDGSPDPDILKNYSAATVAEHNQRRFKVPAYRHPDPLRHPVFVDFGNSRWGIQYSALKAAQDRTSLTAKLTTAKTDTARKKIQQQLSVAPDLHGVTLDLWTGEVVDATPLCWHGKRLWKDLDLQHFGDGSATVATRADRLGRAVSGQPAGAVSIAEVFSQKDWNGRLQVPRKELDRLADLIYGKHAEPDFARLEQLATDPNLARARKSWEHLNWFLTSSAKLKPQGPWLNYVERGLPEGIEFKSGRSGPYLNYAANKDRKGRARLTLSRLPGLRILSLDLGHRYAAACAVWETLSQPQMEAACKESGHPMPNADQLYIHLRRRSDKLQKSGARKGQAIEETTVYRRIGPDHLPDGSTHPAPWARLDRQFLIKLPGEEKPPRFATCSEFESFNQLRGFVGLAADMADPLQQQPANVNRRIDDVQAESVRIAQLGLRRLGNVARVAHIVTASRKPVSGGRTSEVLGREQRIEYVTDALVLWQELAQSTDYTDEWAREQWARWVKGKFDGPQPVELPDDANRSERKKRMDASRGPLRKVAEALADADAEDNRELHRLWAEQWEARSNNWKEELRRLRRLILPRIGMRPSGNEAERHAEWKEQAKAIRQTGGLSVRRLKTIRDLYQVLKAYRMRPEPSNLRANVPVSGDESLAQFGRRILDQLERLREQRIKQLASRILEAALGVGSECRANHWNGRKRAATPIGGGRFAPCHAVVVENLENYRPEETRLRRENRQRMGWGASDVLKYIVEGCKLYGLYFAEVSPSYTSRQDSRTGAPGIRCEDIPRSDFHAAVDDLPEAENSSRRNRLIRRWKREVARLRSLDCDPSNRDRVLMEAIKLVGRLPGAMPAIRVPCRGGELFVSANPDSPAAKGLQADLNAAANIGLKALLDPDFGAAWWFVLVDAATGLPDPEKVKGCPLWSADGERPLMPAVPVAMETRRKSGRSGKGNRTSVYKWNPFHWTLNGQGENASWEVTGRYWEQVESAVASDLIRRLTIGDVPW